MTARFIAGASTNVRIATRGTSFSLRKRLESKLQFSRHWLATMLSHAATKIGPKIEPTGTIQLPTGELFKLPNVGRVDFEALREGRVQVRYTALDPVWTDQSVSADMIPLRDHMMRLCGAAEEFSNRHDDSEDWRAVAENLHLAASLRDLSANTDVNGDSFMCGTAADFDEAHSEVAAKYLAGIIVFNLTWGAYEWAVEIASSSLNLKTPKGARGRDLLFRVFGDKHFPYLRCAVLDALDRSSSQCLNFSTREMRRMLGSGSLAGVAAEYLREFRNALAHGSLNKPFPDDWGEHSQYHADKDPAIQQFHYNTRLTLLLIQILLRSAAKENDDLSGWFSEPQSAALVLTQLHCPPPKGMEILPFADAPLLKWRDHYFYRQVSRGEASLND